ncbi:MAG: hypothetical protein QNJ68_00850 [Microcoleaceae cyanobacterium MO_207.B10]|nr:hypothetical protein [Microcoleaceae cyanobacterium MO_207.B10]
MGEVWEVGKVWGEGEVWAKIDILTIIMQDNPKTIIPYSAFEIDEPDRHNQNPAVGAFCSATYKAAAWREPMAIRPYCGLPK